LIKWFGNVAWAEEEPAHPTLTDDPVQFAKRGERKRIGLTKAPGAEEAFEPWFLVSQLAIL
jgi:hypothetical protein